MPIHSEASTSSSMPCLHRARQRGRGLRGTRCERDDAARGTTLRGDAEASGFVGFRHVQSLQRRGRLQIQVLAGLARPLERLRRRRRRRRRRRLWLWRLRGLVLLRWSLCRLRLLIQLDPDAVSRRSWLVRPLQLDWRSVGLGSLLGRFKHMAWGRRSARDLHVLPCRLLLFLGFLA